MSDGLKSYDVEHYTLRNDIRVAEKAIAGSSDITFRANHPMLVLELDFDGLYTIDGVSDSGGKLDYTRDAAKIYVALRSEVAVGDTDSVSVAYHGQPHEAERAPWGQEKLGVAETPHLGMEHQTINAYGNDFRRDDYGFDWLFHHELAHEWFGNVMSHVTVSDMWLHEGFGAFMQSEYTREVLGDAAFYARMYSAYLNINACNAIAPRKEFSADELYFDDPDGHGPAGDIYSKGTWLLHSLRYLVGEDEFWRAVRILVYDTPEPASLTPPIVGRLRSTDDFMRIASDVAGEDLTWFFEVYARRGPLPKLTVNNDNDDVLLEWQEIGELDFPMPIPVRINGDIRRVEFSENRAILTGVSSSDIQVDPYMRVLRKLSIVPTCEERRAEEAHE